MLGLGRSLFSHLWPSGGSAQRLKKQVSSPLSSLMLRLTDNKLKRKPDSEINVSKRRSPGKTCMTGTLINIADGWGRQRVFSPLEKVDPSRKRQPQPALDGRTEQMMIRKLKFFCFSLFRVQSHALLHFRTGEQSPMCCRCTASGSIAQRYIITQTPSQQM